MDFKAFSNRIPFKTELWPHEKIRYTEEHVHVLGVELVPDNIDALVGLYNQTVLEQGQHGLFFAPSESAVAGGAAS